MKRTLRTFTGDTVEASIAPWTTTGETVTKYLVVIPNVGSTFMSPDELEERTVR